MAPSTKWGHVAHVVALEKKKMIRVDNDIESYSRNCHHLFLFQTRGSPFVSEHFDHCALSVSKTMLGGKKCHKS